MNRPPHHSSRWSLRRTLLGIALVLHVAWLSLGMVPVGIGGHARDGDRDFRTRHAVHALP